MAIDRLELLKHCKHRATAMKEAQSEWKGDWQQASEYIDPTRGRFSDKQGKPIKRSRAKIINSKATEVLRVMAAGMMSHMTSKARPWFKAGIANSQQAELFGVRVWLDAISQLLRDTLAGSNFYKAMPVVYTEDGLFGTAPMLVLEDSKDVVRFYPLTCGTYAVGLDDDQRVDSLWRQYSRTARQLEKRYGRDRLPRTVQNALDRGGDEKFWLQSLIEPNPDAKPGMGPLGIQAPHLRPYREVVWIDAGTDDGTGVLDIGGHYEAPFVVARWNPVAEDIYSTSPAVDTLGDIKQLQYLEGEKLRIMEQLSDPTLAVPDTLRTRGGAKLRKGAHIYLPLDESRGAEVKPVYTPDARSLAQIREEIATIEARIERAFFYQLFLMMESLGDQTGRTATEIAERREEKAAVLGPTLESITDEVLDPVIIRVFRLLERAGRIPDLPEALAGTPLQIEYTSILAQAAKANGVSTIERVVQFASGVAQATGNPAVLDKLDGDQAVDEYSNAVGGPASIIRSDDNVASMRTDRAQQQQMQQMAALAQPMKDGAQAIKTAGEAVPEDGSAAQALMDAMGGGQ